MDFEQVLACPCLPTSINLSGQRFGDQGLERLASALAPNRNISAMLLRGCGFSAQGVPPFAAWLRTCPSLLLLDLRGNRIGPGIKLIAEALGSTTTLQTLMLQSTLLTDEGVVHLATAFMNNTSLTTLDLSMNQIQVNGAKSLAALLRSNKTLQTLNLGFNNLDDDSIGVVGELAPVLADSALTDLDLSSNSFSQTGMSQLSGPLCSNTKLLRLNLSRASGGGQEIAQVIAATSTLQSLDVSYHSLTVDDSLLIAQALETNQSITSLELHNNCLHQRAFASVFTANRTLKSVNLRNCTLLDGGATALAAALEENSSLEELKLGQNGLSDTAAQPLAAMLRVNSTLKSLDLRINDIGDRGAQSFADALQANSTLTSLNLVNNALTSLGGDHLAEALRSNSTLLAMLLDWDRFGEEGEELLATVQGTVAKNVSPPLVLMVRFATAGEVAVATCTTLGGSEVARVERPPSTVLTELRSAILQSLAPELVDITKRHVRLVLPNRNLLHDRATTQTIADVLQ